MCSLETNSRFPRRYYVENSSDDDAVVRKDGMSPPRCVTISDGSGSNHPRSCISAPLQRTAAERKPAIIIIVPSIAIAMRRQISVIRFRYMFIFHFYIFEDQTIRRSIIFVTIENLFS